MEQSEGRWVWALRLDLNAVKSSSQENQPAAPKPLCHR